MRFTFLHIKFSYNCCQKKKLKPKFFVSFLTNRGNIIFRWTCRAPQYFNLLIITVKERSNIFRLSPRQFEIVWLLQRKWDRILSVQNIINLKFAKASKAGKVILNLEQTLLFLEQRYCRDEKQNVFPVRLCRMLRRSHDGFGSHIKLPWLSAPSATLTQNKRDRWSHQFQI